MKVTRGETKDRQIVLHIEVDDTMVEEHMKRAHQKVAARVNVPGFRKGKAPRSVIERFVGREYLLEEALETLVPDAVSTAVESESLEASATPRVSVADRDPVVKLDATVPLSPEATLSDYSDIRFDDKLEEVTDEQIEENVSRLQESNATWEDASRPVEAGDLVTVTMKGTVEGQDFVEQSDSEYMADPENPNPVPGFSASLVGIEIGGSKSFSLEIPEDFRNTELAGKTADFEVSVSSTKAKVLPELTDELVKGLGEELNTLADLRTRIRENLEARAEQTLKESLEEKVIDALVERASFEVSPILIEHEAEHILHDQQQALSQYNISFEQYLAQTGQTSEQLIDGAKESAAKRLKRTLVMDQLADAEKVEPSDDEIEAEIEQWKAQQEGNDSADYDSEESRKAVVTVLRRRKAMERAIEIAQSAPTGAAKRKTSGTKKKTAASKAKKPKATAKADKQAAEEESEA